MTERADFLVNSRSPRYLHGFQKDTNETTELPHTVPVGSQVTYTDSFTNYGVDTVYGKEYVIAAGASPTVHNSLPGRSDTDTHPASSITNTPAGSIAATTVQAAINELDSEKAQLAAALTNQRVPFANASGFLTDDADFYYVAGTGLRVSDTTASTSTTSGSFVTPGGIGCGGSIYAGQYRQVTTSNFSGLDLIPNLYDYTLNNGSISGALYGNQCVVHLTGTTSAAGTSVFVHYSRPYMRSSGAVGSLSAYVSDPHFFSGASGAVTELCGFRAGGGFYGGTASSTITNFKQICVSNPFSNNVTNKYGLWIDSITGATNNWAIYVAGGLTYLGGRLHVNDSTSATSTTTGAITSKGGIATRGALWAGNGGNMAGTNAIFGDAETDRRLIFRTGSSIRWRFQCNGAAESGSNAGSDFDFVAHDDSGGTIDVPLSIVRAAGGLMTLARPSKFTGNVGFNNAAPITKPTVTGSRGGNAALASLLTALANYGLITDSTTA